VLVGVFVLNCRNKSCITLYHALLIFGTRRDGYFKFGTKLDGLWRLQLPRSGTFLQFICWL